MFLSIISSIFSVLLVGFAIASEGILLSWSWRLDWMLDDYRILGIALSAIHILIGLLEFAIAIAATTCSCRVLSSLNDNPGSVYPGSVHPRAVYHGAVYPGAVYPGAVYSGAVHPGAFDYQNPGAVMVSPGSVGYQYPGSPQVAAHQMAAPQMAAPQMAAPQMDEPQIQIQEV